MQFKIFDIHRKFPESDQEMTAQIFKNKINGVADKPKLVLETFQQHNDKLKQLVGTDYALGTLIRYQTRQYDRGRLLLSTIQKQRILARGLTPEKSFIKHRVIFDDQILVKYLVCQKHLTLPTAQIDHLHFNSFQHHPNPAFYIHLLEDRFSVTIHGSRTHTHFICNLYVGQITA